MFLELKLYTDVARLGAQVISGIGFIGAGSIIVTRHQRVKGLTTAAGIWMTACVGLAVGSGMYAIATAAALLIVVSLRLFEGIEQWLLKGAEQKIIRIKTDTIVDDMTPYHTFFDKYGVHIMDEYIRYDYSQGFTTMNFMVRTKDNTDFIDLFKEIHALGNILSLTLSNEVNN